MEMDVVLEVGVGFRPHVQLVLGNKLHCQSAENINEEEQEDESVAHEICGVQEASDEHLDFRNLEEEA
jgi:hypothetical protein